MAAAVNLIRNARVFFTSNVDDVTGVIKTSGFLPTNTREIKVLDGLSFSQSTSTENVTINESGVSPLRGSVTYNTALEPVDFSFSTYMCPSYADLGTVGDTAEDYVDAEESVLWSAISSAAHAGAAESGWQVTEGIEADRVSTVGFDNSNKNQLLKFGLLIVMDNLTYALHNCALESVSLDFGIDAIATLAWSGRAISYEQLATHVTLTDNTATRVVTFGGGIGGTAGYKLTGNRVNYLANKLSTVKIVSTDTTPKTWILPITGGSLTINNNLTYLTPATVGVVNRPLTYFTGARSMSGSLTAYLKFSSDNSNAGTSSELLEHVLDNSINDDQNQYELTVNIGGTSSTKTRVDLIIPTAMLAVPTIGTDQVVTTEIQFVPQGSNAALDDTDELTLEYYAGTVTYS